ncbi:Cof-like hydrolase [Fannyhessea vaginae PB189-T1-4]|uniref:Cof-like hydrolase n=1 Tax=Fannyhessea vaginae PB189-T1-4 TaxID=866774 RepID=A0ABN0AZ48_9ACTN|nr:Cof-type HAD-IIB family hydrolase [Fannyhessea vaginae]EFL43806.1 Cof-like hydrolase [Fannyhessea vaginae PB189-T1-4]
MTEWRTKAPIKAAFFDIDGTLLSHVTNRVPQSAYAALRALKNHGVMPVLATGRPSYMLDVLDTSYFDAFVTINGQYCYKGDTVIYSCPINPRDIETIVSQVNEGMYPCQFQELDCVYVNTRCERVIQMEQFVNQHYDVQDISRALTHDVYQLNAYLHPGEEHLLLDATHDVKIARWSDLFIDVMPTKGGKSNGVRSMLEYCNLSPREVICFGDGGNDSGMFSLCENSVAMGNAQDEIKAQASFITDDIDDDGIYHACERLGFID